uniref:Interleukin 22 n=1 Tax=Salvator merianae TaxID=96440 RepID=A0A8D0DUP2_SALMN
MNAQKNLRMWFLVWIFSSCYLPHLFTVSSLPLKRTDTSTNHSCMLSKTDFQKSYIKNHVYSLAKEGRFFDKDTQNRFIGQHLFVNITEGDRCYLMKRVSDIVVTDVLADKKNQYSRIQEVATFLIHLNMQLSKCKSLGDGMNIERNLNQMKDKLDQLGEDGKNKAVGELDLLFEYLEKTCTEAPKKSSNQTGKKKH